MTLHSLYQKLKIAIYYKNGWVIYHCSSEDLLERSGLSTLIVFDLIFVINSWYAHTYACWHSGFLYPWHAHNWFTKPLFITYAYGLPLHHVGASQDEPQILVICKATSMETNLRQFTNLLDLYILYCVIATYSFTVWAV